jgi:hypothetical protein
MLASALVDTSALWKIVVVGFAAGAGVVIAFGFAVLGASRLSDARHGGALARGGYVLLVLLGAVFCVGAVVLGLWAMTQK